MVNFLLPATRRMPIFFIFKLHNNVNFPFEQIYVNRQGNTLTVAWSDCRLVSVPEKEVLMSVLSLQRPYCETSVKRILCSEFCSVFNRLSATRVQHHNRNLFIKGHKY